MKKTDSERTGSTVNGDSDFDSHEKSLKPRRGQISFNIYSQIQELFDPPGYHQVYLKEKACKTRIARRGVDKGGDVN